MLKIQLIFTIIFLLSACSSMNAEELDKEWEIILPPKPHATESYAAEELQSYVKRIADLDLKIVKSAGLPSGKGIVIGTPESADTIRAHEKELRLNADRNQDSLAVKSIGGNLILAGNNPRSALYAVYTFLADICGVRWLWPGKDGEFVAKKTISFHNPAIYWKSPFQYRGFHLCSCYKGSDPETETWMARHKINIMRAGPNMGENLKELVKKGFHIMFSNHNIALPKTRFKEEPEIFALRNGKRIPDQLCWNHPKVAEYFIKHFTRLCKQHPELEILSLFPADNRNYCQCPRCSGQTLPDLWFSFYMKIVNGVKASCPDKKFASIAYEGYQLPPESTDLRSLDLLEYCQYERCYVHKLEACRSNQNSMKRIEQWKKKNVRLGIYGYEFDIFTPSSLILPHYNMLADQLKTFRDQGVISIIPEIIPLNTYKKTSPSPLQSNRLGYYVYAALMNDPDAEVQKVIEDYCRTAYGKASPSMIRYFSALDETWGRMKIHLTHYGLTPHGVAEKFLLPELIAKINKLFAEAEKATASVSDAEERKRIGKELATEKKVFQAWHDIYLQDRAAKSSVTIPQAVKKGNFSNAAHITGFDAGKQESYPTELWMNWDSEALYVKAVCHDPKMENLKASSRKYDRRLWETDETLNLFFSTPEDQKSGTYRQFTVNPAGTRYDAIDCNGDRNEAWNPVWEAEILTGKKDWSVLIRIPFKELGHTPAPQETWGFSAIRTNGRRKDFGTAAYPSFQSQWQPHAFSPLYFTKRTETIPTAIFARPSNYPPSVVEKMGQAFSISGFQAMASTEEKEFEKAAETAAVIIICHPNSKFKTEFYRDKILPALKSGAIVIFASYGSLPLQRYFNMPELTLHWSGWDIDKQRTIRQLSNAEWLTKPNDLLAVLKNCQTPASGYRPVKPEAWENIGSIRMKNGQLYSCFLTKIIGKGQLVVLSSDFIGWNTKKAILSGNQEQAVMLVENLLQRRKQSCPEK